MQRRDHIDNQVKKALDGMQPAYREDLWKGIEQQLPAQKKPFAMYWRGVAALLLITAGSTGLYFMNSATDKTTANNVVTVENAVKNPGEKTGSQTIIDQQLQKENAYNTSAKNALTGKQNNTSSQIKRNRSIGLSGNNSAAVNVGNQLVNTNKDAGAFIAASAADHSIYTKPEKYLERVILAVNEVDNTTGTAAGKYANKPTSVNPNKKRNNTDCKPISKITTYAFWQNAAYTGEQGKLNISFDDKIAYLKGENYSACQNNAGIEFAIPKSRFAVGAYHQRFLKQFSLKTASGLSASARLFNVGNGYFKAGAGVTYLSSKLFKNNLNFSDQIDAKAGFINTSRERDFTSVQNTVGADAGIWYSSPRLMAGISAKNINQPQFGRIEEGERLRREWNVAAGYIIPAGNNISIMPWAEVKTTSISRQTSTMVLVSYKDMLTIGAGYMNISPLTLRGDIMVQASAEIRNRLQVYGMYGRNMEMQSLGLQQNIIQTGLRYHVQ